MTSLIISADGLLRPAADVARRRRHQRIEDRVLRVMSAAHCVHADQHQVILDRERGAACRIQKVTSSRSTAPPERSTSVAAPLAEAWRPAPSAGL
jgi:hypothetical protein